MSNRPVDLNHHLVQQWVWPQRRGPVDEGDINEWPEAMRDRPELRQDPSWRQLLARGGKAAVQARLDAAASGRTLTTSDRPDHDPAGQRALGPVTSGGLRVAAYDGAGGWSTRRPVDMSGLPDEIAVDPGWQDFVRVHGKDAALRRFDQLRRGEPPTD